MILCPEQPFGVPCGSMLELIQCLHDGMSATVTVGGGKSEPFLVCIKGVPLSYSVYPVVIGR